MDSVIYKVVGWALNAFVVITLFAFWLGLYLIAVMIKAVGLAVSGGKADLRVWGYNHRKAVQKRRMANEAPPVYLGWGGWKHRFYRYYLSQIVYIYVTDLRILLVSKNHGSHEFLLDEVNLTLDESTGHIEFRSATDYVSLGSAGMAIPGIVRAVNDARSG